MSQSTMSTRFTPSAWRAWRAAIATELNTQKPIAMCASAWWPGGRTTAIPLRDSPRTTASVTAITAPAASCATLSEDELR